MICCFKLVAIKLTFVIPLFSMCLVIAYAWRLVQFLETKTITGVLDAYEEGILGRYPRARISIGHDFHFIFVPLMLVPEWLGDWVITRLKNPPKPRVLH